MTAHLACKPLAAGPYRAALLGAVSAGAVGHRADGVPRQGPGKPADRCARPSDRLAADRPAVHGRRVFPAPAFGGIVQRCRLRRFQLGRQQLPAPRPRGPAARPDREIPQRPEEGPAVAPDIESWFQKDQFEGKPGIVAQWAALHSRPIAQNWVEGRQARTPPTWPTGRRTHPTEVAQWIKANPDTPEPKPEDLAVPFFTSFSKDHPGTFPSAVEHKTADGKTEKTDRAGQGRGGHPVRLLRHVAAGPSGRRTWSRSRPTW